MQGGRVWYIVQVGDLSANLSATIQDKGGSGAKFYQSSHRMVADKCEQIIAKTETNNMLYKKDLRPKETWSQPTYNRRDQKATPSVEH